MRTLKKRLCFEVLKVIKLKFSIKWITFECYRCCNGGVNK